MTPTMGRKKPVWCFVTDRVTLNGFDQTQDDLATYVLELPSLGCLIRVGSWQDDSRLAIQFVSGVTLETFGLQRPEE